MSVYDIDEEITGIAYVGEKPWHGKGVEIPADLPIGEAIQAANLNFKLELRKLRVVDGKVIPGRKALVRDDNDAYFDIVGAKYKPVQPVDAVTFFDRFTKAGHMKLETLGHLFGGKYVWGLARIQGDRKVGGTKDVLRNYTMINSPNVLGKTMTINQTSVRVVCWNTHQAALSEGDIHYKLNHVRAWDDKAKDEAEECVMRAIGAFNKFADAADTLSAIKMSQDTQIDFLKKVFRLDDASLAARKNKDDADAPFAEVAATRKSPFINRFISALNDAPGAQLDSALGTAWGAFNAVTYLCDHKLGNDQDLRLMESWTGYRGKIKDRALELALDELV